MSRAKKSNHDYIDRFLERGLDIQNRLIYFGSENYTEDGGESGVDHASAQRLITSLMSLDLLAPEGDQPIKIILNNTGGDYNHGMSIYDAIKSCKNPVEILVYGQAMSMGSVILQASTRRILSPHAKIMIHFGSMGWPATHAKIFEKWAEESKRMNTEMENVYLDRIQEKHPRFSRSQLQKLLNFDTILSAKDAVTLGLADEIMEVKK